MLVRRSFFLGLSLSLSCLVGCSDDPAAPADAAADAGGGDTAVPADTGAPGDTGAAQDSGVAPDASDAGAGCSLTRALVATSTFGMGGGYALGAITPPSLAPATRAAPDQDHAVVQSGCVAFDLLRTNDQVDVLDAMALPAVRRSIPLRSLVTGDAGTGGNLANPYDVLLVSPTKAYVVLYALPTLAVIDPTREGAGAITGRVDLAPARAAMDADASPEAAAIARVGGRAYVALQNLSAFSPVANGTLAVIDTATDRLATPATITLGGRNPQALAVAGTRLVVAMSGAFGALDGGLEAVDTTTGTPSGVLVTEAQLGGDVSSLVMLSESRGWAVVTRMATGDAGASYSRVVEFDLAARTVREAPVFSTGAFNLAGLALDPAGNVWVLDRSPTTGGVVVFRPAAGGGGAPVTTAPLATGTHPASGIAFVP